MKLFSKTYNVTKEPETVGRSITIAAVASACFLIIPFLAMQFSKEFNWTLFDFIAAWVLLFGAGLSYKLVTRKMSDNLTYRIAAGIGAASALFLIWANLAVGIIGNENNPVNLMYFGVLAVGILGLVISRFKTAGLSYTLYSMAFTQLIIAVFALIAGMEHPGEIIMVNGFFILLFVISGLLFQFAGEKLKTQKG